MSLKVSENVVECQTAWIWVRHIVTSKYKFTSIDTVCIISSSNPKVDHLLESSQRDDSNKWSNIELGEEI